MSANMLATLRAAPPNSMQQPRVAGVKIMAPKASPIVTWVFWLLPRCMVSDRALRRCNTRKSVSFFGH